MLFYAVVGFLLFLVIAKLVLISRDIFSNIPQMYEDNLEPLITDLFEQFKTLTERLDPNIAQMVQNATASFVDSSGSLVSNLSAKVLGYLSNTFISLPGIILFIVFSIVSSVFFSMDFTKISGYITDILPDKMNVRLKKLKTMAADIGGKYVKSYAIIIAITFAELSLGLLILGVDNAIALAAVIAFIDLLPVLGTGAVLIPWSLILLIMGNYGLAIGLAVLYVVMLIVRNILEPRIVGRQIGVHPLAMLVSMYAGLKIFGFIGIFVVPLVLLAVKGFLENKPDAPPDKPTGPLNSDGCPEDRTDTAASLADNIQP